MSCLSIGTHPGSIKDDMRHTRRLASFASLQLLPRPQSNLGNVGEREDTPTGNQGAVREEDILLSVCCEDDEAPAKTDDSAFGKVWITDRRDEIFPFSARCDSSGTLE